MLLASSILQLTASLSWDFSACVIMWANSSPQSPLYSLLILSYCRTNAI
jgi:hypothetical protein